MHPRYEKQIAVLAQTREYIVANGDEWQEVMFRAAQANPWFTLAHIQLATNNIVEGFLQTEQLMQWSSQYTPPTQQRLVGIVMAGNIPMVGFHDLLCGWMSGHRLLLKLSSKDEVLIKHLVGKWAEWAPELAGNVTIADRLNGCDAYIATGSNNTTRYFEQYFGKYPHIIRKNRTSVAVLDGAETEEELRLLADDIYQFYGLGCRNVTQVCVPTDYDFVPLLRACNKHNEYADLNKYKNNYDYHLAIYLLNRVPYMSNESILLVENMLPFSAVSVLHYRYYDNLNVIVAELSKSSDIQAIIGHAHLPFGSSQKPLLSDYADGVDTMAFLCGL